MKSTKPPRGAVRFFFSGWHPPMLQMIRRRRCPARRRRAGTWANARWARAIYDICAATPAMTQSQSSEWCSSWTIWERTCVRRGDAGRISRYELRDGMRYRRPTGHELDDRGRTAQGPLRPRKAPHAARRRGASPRDATRGRAAGTRAMRAGWTRRGTPRRRDALAGCDTDAGTASDAATDCRPTGCDTALSRIAVGTDMESGRLRRHGTLGHRRGVGARGLGQRRHVRARRGATAWHSLLRSRSERCRVQGSLMPIAASCSNLLQNRNGFAQTYSRPFIFINGAKLTHLPLRLRYGGGRVKGHKGDWHNFVVVSIADSPSHAQHAHPSAARRGPYRGAQRLALRPSYGRSAGAPRHATSSHVPCLAA